MNIKSLLLGSAAALAVVSGAQAADAIVAAEPEPMEYVRVCDAFGTGYFYIPGTETCLKISGSVRFAYDWAYDDAKTAEKFTGDFQTRARVEFQAKSDSELGTIGSYIRLQATSDGSQGAVVEQAYITVGGFKAGYAVNFWDDIGVAGETDKFAAFTKGDMVSYTYTTDAFAVGLGVDEFTSAAFPNGAGFDDLGLNGKVTASVGGVDVGLYGVYDWKMEEGALALQLAAAVGPGKLGLYGAWASGVSRYAETAEWTIGGAYALKATDKLTLTASASYWDSLKNGAVFGTVDQWGAGLLAEYKLAKGLDLSATVDYKDPSNADGTWSGFVRLVRSF